VSSRSEPVSVAVVSLAFSPDAIDRDPSLLYGTGGPGGETPRAVAPDAASEEADRQESTCGQRGRGAR